MAAVTVVAMGMPPCSLGFSCIVPRGGLGDKVKKSRINYKKSRKIFDV